MASVTIVVGDQNLILNAFFKGIIMADSILKCHIIERRLRNMLQF